MVKSDECATGCQQSKDFGTWPEYSCSGKCAYLGREMRLMMTIDGQEVPSSCVKTGTRKDCEKAGRRWLKQKDRDRRAGWIILPCL